jgi:hypothetical protein
MKMLRSKKMERSRPGKAEVDMDPFSDYLESEEVCFCFK